MTTSAGSLVGPKWASSRPPGGLATLAPVGRCGWFVPGAHPLRGVHRYPLGFRSLLELQQLERYRRVALGGFRQLVTVFFRSSRPPLATGHLRARRAELARADAAGDGPRDICRRHPALPRLVRRYLHPSVVDVDGGPSPHVAGGACPQLWRVGISELELAPGLFKPELVGQSEPDVLCDRRYHRLAVRTAAHRSTQAGRRAIPAELYDAAKVDGASTGRGSAM